MSLPDLLTGVRKLATELGHDVKPAQDKGSVIEEWGQKWDHLSEDAPFVVLYIAREITIEVNHRKYFRGFTNSHHPPPATHLTST